MSSVWSSAILKAELSSDEAGIRPSLVKVFSSRGSRKKKKFVHTYADPFLLASGGRIYLFLEVKRYGELGKICVFSTRDGKTWESDGVALEGKHHLSYPFVFESEGDQYLIPETRSKGEVSLFAATDFPTKWKKTRVLVQGDYVDSSVWFHNGVWWLFCSRGYDELHIFSAISLYDNWVPHPQNPVVKNASFARNAGGIFSWKNRHFRMAQDCEGGYGRCVRFREILALSKERYIEISVESLVSIPSFEWNTAGGHHLNFLQVDDVLWIATDGKSRAPFLRRIQGALLRSFTGKIV